MQQIIFFFIRNKNFLLFAVLFGIALSFVIQSHNYHNGKFISSANFLSGGIYSIKSDITQYFKLRKENDNLVEENVRLRALIENYKNSGNPIVVDTIQLDSGYTFNTARIINNNYSKTKNHLTLNKGSSHGIEVDMGVITTKGILGIVSHTSERYTIVQSILNTNSQINAKLKNSNQFGTLKWNAGDVNVVQLVDVPRQAVLNIGDTVVTGGKSTIFPKGLLIGSVEQFELRQDDSYDIDIRLFNDMTNLDYVYLIKNQNAQEILTLEKQTEDAQE